MQNLLFALLSDGLLFGLQAFDLDQFLYIGSGLWQAYFSSALMEELPKWFILQRLLQTWLSSFAFPTNASASPFSATAAQNRLFCCHYAALCAIWGLLLGLGFSATENLFYILRFGYSSLYLRLGTAVLVHLGLGAFVAVRLYGYSLLSGCKPSRIAKPSKLSKRLKSYAPIRSLLWAIFLHGTYNAALHFGSLLLALAIVLLIVSLAFFSYRQVCGLSLPLEKQL